MDGSPRRYRVEPGLYCHHVNYWPLRPVIQDNRDYVASYNQRVLEVLAESMAPAA